MVSRRCAVDMDMTSVIGRMSATGTSGSSSCTAAINDGTSCMPSSDVLTTTLVNG